MKVSEEVACSFDNWYPKFRKWSIKSEIVSLPDDVLHYLLSDIVVVPQEATIETAKTSDIDDITYSIWDSDDEDDDDDDDDVELPSFPEFSKKLHDIMKKFGGYVFVKSNWSAPTDAAWIATNNSLKCSNLQDLYLLLKGSEKIAKDLDTSGPGIEHFIVIKKWCDIHPGSEFRCFVKGGELIAITQRDSCEFFHHIHLAKYDIVNDVKNFFHDRIEGKFLLRNFSFDVVWDRSGVQLMDFGKFGDKKNSTYLFNWDELNEMDYVEGISPEFRYIGEDVGIQPANLGRHFGLPSDLRNVSQDQSRSIIEMIQNQIDLQKDDD